MISTPLDIKSYEVKFFQKESIPQISSEAGVIGSNFFIQYSPKEIIQKIHILKRPENNIAIVQNMKWL